MRSAAAFLTLLFSADKRVEAIAAIMRDETARWNEERVLREQLGKK